MYSFRLRVNNPMQIYVQFNTLDSVGNINGSYRKWFNITAQNTWITFSGNLAEPGWAPNPFAAAATPFILNNPTGHQVFFEINELNGNPKSTTLRLDVDDMLFYVPEPKLSTLVFVLCFGALFTYLRLRRRSLEN